MTGERNAPENQGAAASFLNGFTALEAFSTSDRPLLGIAEIAEIAEIVNLHKSTVSRMLTGLSEP